MKKLEYHELKRFCDYKSLGFETTESLSANKEIIGQGRAVSAFTFGLATRRSGYNIYVSGISGSGKTTFAKHFASQVAAGEPCAPDLAYVYNFKEPKEPKLLSLSSGMGAEFKDDLQEMIDILTVEIPKTFEGKNFEEQRNEIAKRFEKRRDEIFRAFAKDAKSKDFEVRITEKGMTFAPIVDGKTIDMEDYDNLTQEQQDQITKNSDEVQEEAQLIVGEIRALDEQAHAQIKELEYNISLFAVGHQIARMQEKYGDCEDILEYLSLLKEDIIENISSFQETDHEEDEALMQLPPWMSRKVKEDITSKYKVNIVADNSGMEGAPVQVCEGATYASIMGEIEYDSEFGNLTTDYMKLKGGLIHKANGGYLVLQAKDVLGIPFLWDALKRTLRSKEITIENPKEQQNTVVSTVRPQVIPFDVKIIMVGAGYYYEIMRAHDEDFADLFKVVAMFDYEMDYTDENIAEICRFVKRFVQEQATLEFSACAVAAVIEYSVRLAGSQKKLTSRFDRICETLTEAYIWA
ncbi:MAG: AAA family ATPase, partial [Defluviitaleaceae bacterium]|nr:AAA family ATPase [Defluviitaleaceae bacterium]